jgi:transcriptional regulator with XRE-family HTH domain
MTTPTSTLIKSAIERLAYRKTRRKIAKEAGLEPNMVSMIKHGKARLPLDRVPALAEALEIDPALLFRTALTDLWPTYETVVRRIFRDVFTSNEWAIVEIVRERTMGKVPDVTPDLRRKIEALFEGEITS